MSSSKRIIEEKMPGWTIVSEEASEPYFDDVAPDIPRLNRRSTRLVPASAMQYTDTSILVVEARSETGAAIRRRVIVHNGEIIMQEG